jgi:hypothetical protein
VSAETINRLVQTVTKLVQTGHFSDGLFFLATLPACLEHYGDEYNGVWNQITQNLPGTVLFSFVQSLVGFVGTRTSSPTHLPIKYNGDLTFYQLSKLFNLFFGPANETSPEVWNVLLGPGRSWSAQVVRALVRWAAGVQVEQGVGQPIEFEKNLLEEIPQSDAILEQGIPRGNGLQILLEQVLARWTDGQFISRALLREHRCMLSSCCCRVNLY